MKIFVGVTDGSWFEFLRDGKYDEVNFWKPSGRNFKAIDEGDLFLFKLKSSEGGKIVGGGYFTRFLSMSMDWAWRAFGNENGVNNLAELSDSINGYRARNKMSTDNPMIGCIILNDVFYFDEQDCFDAPGNWSGVVVGKTFAPDMEDFEWLREQIEIRRQATSVGQEARLESEGERSALEARYVETVSKHRLGQGAFRALVANAYHNRCAISGERTMPVLQAAHIRPYSDSGPHEVSNGLFLRSDIHTLFDAGYITVTPKLDVRVSRRIHEDFGNGRIYYAFDKRQLQVIPDDSKSRPFADYLEWHNDTVFRA